MLWGVAFFGSGIVEWGMSEGLDKKRKKERNTDDKIFFSSFFSAYFCTDFFFCHLLPLVFLLFYPFFFSSFLASKSSAGLRMVELQREEARRYISGILYHTPSVFLFFFSGWACVCGWWHWGRWYTGRQLGSLTTTDRLYDIMTSNSMAKGINHLFLSP